MFYGLVDQAVHVATAISQQIITKSSTTTFSATVEKLNPVAVLNGIMSVPSTLAAKMMSGNVDPTLNFMITPRVYWAMLMINDNNESCNIDLSDLDEEELEMLLDYIDALYEHKGIREGVFDIEDFDD